MFPKGNVLVGPGEDGAFRRRLAAVNASSGPTRLLQGDAAHGGASLFLDFGFALRASAPEGESEPILDGLFQVFVRFRIVGVALAKSQSLVVQRLLDFRQKLLNSG